MICAQNPFKAKTAIVLFACMLAWSTLPGICDIVDGKATAKDVEPVHSEMQDPGVDAVGGMSSNTSNDLVSGKSIGHLYLNDSGEPHGGFEYCAAYYATLALDDSVGTLTFDFLIGIGDKLTKKEYAVELIEYSPEKIELLFEGEPLILEWIEQDMVWNEWHEYYIASCGVDLPPESEWLGTIDPDMFEGIVSTYYVELRLPWIFDYSGLAANPDTLSITSGGTIDFELDAGEHQANRNYFLLGSASVGDAGTLLPRGNARLSICWDLLTDLIVPNMNTAVFQDFMGILDIQGRATAKLETGALPPHILGHRMCFAYCCNQPFDVVSNPVIVKIVM